MGVDQTHYVMIGVKLTPDDPAWPSDPYEDEDGWLAFIEGRPDVKLDCVYDGMCGEYLVLGEILASSSEYDGLEFTEIDFDENSRHAVEGIVSEFLGDTRKATLMAFTHFH